MPREMLKLRKGDSAIMIKADGSMELAGMDNKPLIDDNGRLSPIILFAAAWAKKDQATMNALLTNFKAAVREGYFGQDAKTDFEAMEKRAAAAASAATTMQQSASGATTVFEANTTPEEKAKQLREEEKLRGMVEAAKYQSNDPKFVRQREAFKKNAKFVDKGPVTQHLEPDLPIEQTFAYQNATPEEQKIMKEEEQKKNSASGTVTKTVPKSIKDKLNEAGVKPGDTKKMNEVLNQEPVVGSATIEEGVDNEDK